MSAQPFPDLSACAREPIHIPGSIQPFGFLLALSPDTLRIEQVSANTALFLGRAATELLGQTLTDVLPALEPEFVQNLRDLEEGPSHYLRVIRLTADDTERVFHAVAHRTGGLIVLEMEAAIDASPSSFQDVYPLIRAFVETLHQTETLEELLQLATREVRRITGVDRVKIYRFDEQWNGCVVAEDRNDRLPSYLNLRFPESDIPAQARRLYHRNRLRLIANASYEPVPLLAHASAGNGQPLDLSLSVLRSVSPVHLEYMRNMGTGASLSVSLLCDGKLWGLIACHNATPLHIPFHVRTACDHLGQILSLQLAARTRVAQSERRNELRAIQVQLLSRMAESDNFMDGLMRSEKELLRLADAAGVAITFGGDRILLGETPKDEEIDALVAWLAERGEREQFVTDQLPILYPEAMSYRDRAAGLMAISISQIHPAYVMWFRPEVVRTVNWGGAPGKETGSDGRLHPRRSFEVWKQTVRLTSAPWDEAEQSAAIELRSAIVGIVLRKAEELAALTAELRRSNKELEAFSYSVSHDLRAPFRHIVGFAELLREREGERVSPRGRHYIDSIIEAAFSAGTLVDNLLSFSQMGRAALHLRRTNLREIVEEARHRLATDLDGRAIRWEIGELGEAKADPAMLRLVLQNLLGNAIKFTRDRNPAEIVITAEEHDDDLIVEVRDNGVGFDMAYVDKLFGVFQRLHHVEEFEGTGIGLANVRRIIERHGGRTWARGKEGEGASFFFSLPRWKSGDGNV